MSPCPTCTAQMSKGIVVVKGLTPQFFMPLFSDQDLWFVRDGEKRKRKVVPSCEKRTAFFCESCGTVCIIPEKPLPPVDFADIGQRIATRLARRSTRSKKQT